MSLRVALLIAVTAFASTPVAADVFEQLVGQWRGGGEVRGMPSEQVMRWGPVLDGGFTRLEFDNTMRAADGSEYRFQAHAYYRAGEDGAITGTWLDSRGVTLPLAGKADEASLHIEWGSETTERGRTAYRLEGDTLEVVDEVLLKDGEWREFGRSVLQRVE
jgi:hypothetical protein